MKNKRFLIPIIFTLSIISTTSLKASEEDHSDLRSLKDAMIEAINQKDHEKLFNFVHPNVVIVTENTQLVRSKTGLEEFIQDVIGSENSPLKDFEIQEFEVTEKSSIYNGRFAFAYGTSKSKYVTRDGSELILPSTWTASLVKEKGSWLITHFQNTVNFMDNPVIDQIKNYYLWLILLGFALGALVAVVAMRLLKK